MNEFSWKAGVFSYIAFACLEVLFPLNIPTINGYEFLKTSKQRAKIIEKNKRKMAVK